MSYAVIIPSYNRPEMLKRALASVYAQTVRPSQICLTIDEPEDGEKYAFLDRYDDALQVTYTGGGYGGAKARNVGLDQVDDVDYVFFLDDDDEWLPEKTEKQIALLDQRPDAIGVTCYYYRIQGGESHIVVKGTEEELNRSVRLWNYTGGFSCFGIRWSANGAQLRLCDALMSSQDFEYYIQVADYGSIAVLNSPMVNYYAHSNTRISGSRLSKRISLNHILKIHSDRFSARERYFTRAKILLLTAPFLGNRMLSVWDFTLGSFFIILSFKAPKLSYRIWMGSFRGVCRCILPVRIFTSK
jgi:glycosyltransferase involved in cell wall biosynthesis